MASLGDSTEAGLLDHYFDLASFPAPANLFVALFTAAPNDAGGGTEVSGGSYARVNVATGTAQWTRTGSTVTNDNPITFPTASGSWGTITHVAVMSASTSGTLLWHGALATSRTVGSGDTFAFPAGQLSFTLD
jgi:hypothetical protein